MDESLNVIYINEVLKSADWKTYDVGQTRFSDQALRKASQSRSLILHADVSDFETEPDNFASQVK